jgi:deoxyinosine 3'endonuclease (endonuclease V)
MRAAEEGSGAAFAAVDVYYPASGGARAALVLAGERTFAEVLAQKTAFVAHAAPYVPGQFLQRELPPLRAVLAGVTGIELLVVDGYAGPETNTAAALARGAPSRWVSSAVDPLPHGCRHR